MLVIVFAGIFSPFHLPMPMSLPYYRCYLHHALRRRHNQPPTLSTILHPKTLHSHLPPHHTPVPQSHLCFGYKQPIPGAQLDFIPTAAKDSTTLTIHTNHFINTCKHPTPHPLAKYTKEPCVYFPPLLTNERSFVGRAQALHRSAFRWYAFSIHSSNGLGCIV